VECRVSRRFVLISLVGRLVAETGQTVGDPLDRRVGRFASTGLDRRGLEIRQRVGPGFRNGAGGFRSACRRRGHWIFR
jgi:hypothetical protein